MPEGFQFVMEGPMGRDSLHVKFLENGKWQYILCDGDIAGPSQPPPAASHLPAGWPCTNWPLGIDRPRVERWIQYAESMIATITGEHIGSNDERLGWNNLFRATKMLLNKVGALNDDELKTVADNRNDALSQVQSWKDHYLNSNANRAKEVTTPTIPAGTVKSEEGKSIPRGGRPPLVASKKPEDIAKLNVYQLIRTAMAEKPSMGAKDLQKHFKSNQDFQERAKQAHLKCEPKMFHAALKWIEENPSHETQSRNVS